jgi:hypothetical protein
VPSAAGAIFFKKEVDSFDIHAILNITKGNKIEGYHD